MSAQDVWEIPEPHSRCEVRLDDETVTTLRRHGNPAGPRLVLSHGNGLAVDAYYPFWSRLEGEFELIVWDLRNHGWNPTGDLRRHSIPTLIGDHGRILEAIDREFGARPKVGVFHSVSALIALLTHSLPDAPPPSAPGQRFESLVLFDPPLYKPGFSDEVYDKHAETLAQRTRRRGNRFRSLEEFSELLEYSPTFRRLPAGIRDLVARATLRPSAGEAGYELRCPPEYEAQIIEYSRSYAGLVNFDSIPFPVKVIGADPTLNFAYLPSFDLSDMQAVDYDFLPEATHLLQLEKPEGCVAALREFLDP